LCPCHNKSYGKLVHDEQTLWILATLSNCGNIWLKDILSLSYIIIMCSEEDKCTKCGEDILPEDDTVQVDFHKRIIQVKHTFYPNAHKVNRLATFHKRCFKLSNLLK
jgi:hypothetical protein